VAADLSGARAVRDSSPVQRRMNWVAADLSGARAVRDSSRVPRRTSSLAGG
jgi:hypothetical protein